MSTAYDITWLECLYDCPLICFLVGAFRLIVGRWFYWRSLVWLEGLFIEILVFSQGTLG